MFVSMDEQILNLGMTMGPMEFFLLALVGKVGLKSLYDLRQQAGLEPGGIRSAMKTLEDNRLVSRSDPGKRRRRDLVVTALGRAFLDRSWQHCLRKYPDGEAVLRSAMVAWVMDGPGAAATYLVDVSHSRLQGAQQMNKDAQHLKNSQNGPLSGYVWMRISNEAHRRGAESEAFQSISRFLFEEYFDKNAENVGQ